ncbi:chemotaxis protein MotB [Pullulanibacillus camelliae]|uniref:Chemotaxis protein MotB n=1 Tax=Pullulanibacillus camelliae TaxID=1707096 RepID=A0A8J2YLA9_9BACL|nr:flagellar motor protein MotB [Pullulanibacillus camelliae]GGE49707.1 chemotaxis protein MotB [Pullulanibacillus camelliae]
MRRRRKKDEQHDQERWLITYSDLITLLLVFFIVLYSMSEVKNDKFNALVQSLKTSFYGDSIVNQSDNPPTTQADIPKVPVANKDDKHDQDDEKQLDALYKKVKTYIDKNHLEGEIELRNLQRGVQITLKEQILFGLGKADIKEKADPILDSMGGILNSVSNPIVVEGHTDNNPIKYSTEFKSNWELAAKRAENVMLYLVNHDNIKESRMRYTSYGEYHPEVKNDTPTHQAMNRRVNIVILRDNDSSTSN